MNYNDHPILAEIDRLFHEYVRRHGHRPERILIPVARAEEYNDLIRVLKPEDVAHLIGITVSMDHMVTQIEMRAALINGFTIATGMPSKPTRAKP